MPNPILLSVPNVIKYIIGPGANVDLSTQWIQLVEISLVDPKRLVNAFNLLSVDDQYKFLNAIMKPDAIELAILINIILRKYATEIPDMMICQKIFEYAKVAQDGYSERLKMLKNSFDEITDQVYKANILSGIDLTSKIAELQVRLDEYKRIELENEDKIVRMNELNKDIALKESNLRILNGYNFNEKNDALNKLTINIKEKNENISTLDNDIEVAKNTLDELQQKVSIINPMCNDLQNEKIDAEKQLHTLQLKFDQLSIDVNNSKKDLLQLQEKKDELKLNNQNYQSDIQNVTGDITELINQELELESSIKLVTDNKDKLHQKVVTLKKIHDEIKIESNEVNKNINILQSEIDEMSIYINETNDTIAHQHMVHNELVIKNQECKAAIKKLNDDVVEQTNKNIDLEAVIKQLRVDADKISADVVDVENKHEELKKDIEEKKLQYAITIEENNEMNAGIQKYNDDLAAMQIENVKIDEMKKRHNELTEQFNNQHTIFEQLCIEAENDNTLLIAIEDVYQRLHADCSDKGFNVN